MRTVVSAIVVVVLTSIAWGQSAEDRASADLAFREGLALLDAGDTEVACTKFEQAQAFDPTSGTLLVLGDCYERLGRTGSAYGTFVEAELLARKEGRQEYADEAAQRLAALSPRLVTITIVLAPGVDAAALVVTRDGAAIATPHLGTALIVDPGDHVIAASAAGFVPWSTSVAIRSGDARIEVPALDPEPTIEPARRPEPLPEPRAEVDEEPERVAAPSKLRRNLGITLIVAGLGGLGAAGYAGYAARTHWDAADPTCDADWVCDPAGYDRTQQAHRWARYGTVAAGLGIASAVIGTLLVLTAPRGVHVAPSLDEDAVGLAASGGF